ncbi:hypothetical protein HZH68_003024 [Vespula germanica]|uniref:Uncharacterized protein n=1 Tax=Vespula germanica TaxID=30212 RepID=A0A834NND7_VESGE|nr:hypothetical protein HZH68_003024 [Vespula germanica]
MKLDFSTEAEHSTGLDGIPRRSPKLQTTEKREAPPVTRPLPLKMPRLLLTMSLRRAGSHPRAFDEIQHLYELELGIKLRREVRLQGTRRKKKEIEDPGKKSTNE